jgi:hypothetical protein
MDEETKEMLSQCSVHNTGHELEFRDAEGHMVRTVGVGDLSSAQELLAFAQVQLTTQLLREVSIMAAATAVSAKALLEMKRVTNAMQQQSPDEMMDKVLSRVQVLMDAGKVPNVSVAGIRKQQGPRCRP